MMFAMQEKSISDVDAFVLRLREFSDPPANNVNRDAIIGKFQHDLSEIIWRQQGQLEAFIDGVLIGVRENPNNAEQLHEQDIQKLRFVAKLIGTPRDEKKRPIGLNVLARNPELVKNGMLENFPIAAAKVQRENDNRAIQDQVATGLNNRKFVNRLKMVEVYLNACHKGLSPNQNAAEHMEFFRQVIGITKGINEKADQISSLIEKWANNDPEKLKTLYSMGMLAVNQEAKNSNDVKRFVQSNLLWDKLGDKIVSDIQQKNYQACISYINFDAKYGIPQRTLSLADLARAMADDPSNPENISSYLDQFRDHISSMQEPLLSNMIQVLQETRYIDPQFNPQFAEFLKIHPGPPRPTNDPKLRECFDLARDRTLVGGIALNTLKRVAGDFELSNQTIGSLIDMVSRTQKLQDRDSIINTLHDTHQTQMSENDPRRKEYQTLVDNRMRELIGGSREQPIGYAKKNNLDGIVTLCELRTIMGLPSFPSIGNDPDTQSVEKIARAHLRATAGSGDLEKLRDVVNKIERIGFSPQQMINLLSDAQQAALQNSKPQIAKSLGQLPYELGIAPTPKVFRFSEEPLSRAGVYAMKGDLNGCKAILEGSEKKGTDETQRLGVVNMMTQIATTHGQENTVRQMLEKPYTLNLDPLQKTQLVQNALQSSTENPHMSRVIRESAENQQIQIDDKKVQRDARKMSRSGSMSKTLADMKSQTRAIESNGSPILSKLSRGLSFSSKAKDQPTMPKDQNADQDSVDSKQLGHN